MDIFWIGWHSEHTPCAASTRGPDEEMVDRDRMTSLLRSQILLDEVSTGRDVEHDLEKMP